MLLLILFIYSKKNNSDSQVVNDWYEGRTLSIQLCKICILEPLHLATTLVMEQRYNLSGLATGSSAVTAGTVLFILQ